MAFKNYRKETSERSDEANWAKKILIEKTGLFFESIEGCNENNNNVVTHLMERARVDFTGEIASENEVLQDIINLEGIDSLKRKINFAKAFNCSLTYVLYCAENKHVWTYCIKDINDCKLINTYNSYEQFSRWIAEIKGWNSSKSFREKQDLPEFDKELRKAGCAWPTNIDCFVSNDKFEPLGIIEFQNANLTSVEKHCNNEFLWGKYTGKNDYGYTIYYNDIRRWLSQEILRVQSNLRLFIITWSESSNDYILKEVEKVTLPDLPRNKNWKLHNLIEENMHQLAVNYRTNKEYALKYADWIMKNTSSYNLEYIENFIKLIHNQPKLDLKEKTFPKLYYKYKHFEKDNKEKLPEEFLNLLAK